MSYNYPHYIKKNGRYLAYRIQTDEYDFLEVSDVDAMYSAGWYWDKDFEKAKQFYSKYEAEKFLRDKTWRILGRRGDNKTMRAWTYFYIVHTIQKGSIFKKELG